MSDKARWVIRELRNIDAIQELERQWLKKAQAQLDKAILDLTKATIQANRRLLQRDKGAMLSFTINGYVKVAEMEDFSREWEGEKGQLLLLDGEPRSHVAEDLLLAAGFRFYRLQGDNVKQATYKTHADGRRGARGWAKTDLTPYQVRKDPYSLWL